MKPYRKILVPTDFSPGAEVALEHALVLRQHLGATLTLLHVYPLPIAYGPPYAYTVDLIGPIERDARAQLEKTSQRARELGAGDQPVPIQAKLAAGAAALSITEEAKEGGYDLIVLGTHGRTGLSHLFIGSVAERVVRTAHCPVLTVRSPEK